jgi:hypothetical protein
MFSVLFVEVSAAISGLHSNQLGFYPQRAYKCAFYSPVRIEVSVFDISQSFLQKGF